MILDWVLDESGKKLPSRSMLGKMTQYGITLNLLNLVTVEWLYNRMPSGEPGWLSWQSMRLLSWGCEFKSHIGLRDYKKEKERKEKKECLLFLRKDTLKHLAIKGQVYNLFSEDSGKKILIHVQGDIQNTHQHKKKMGQNVH